jgi:hypothetical protein
VLPLTASGQLDLGVLGVRTFSLARLEEALDAASKMRGPDCTAMTMDHA